MSPRSLGEGRLVWPLDRAPTRALIDALRAIEGVLDVAASEQDVLCALRDPSDAEMIARVERALREPSARDEGAVHTVELVYDGADLEEVAERAGLSREAVIDAHAGREYAARATGFAPGWAYLGELDPRIQVPRRPAARARVAAGSVAIADARTGIYPFDMPGGWSVLGSAAGGFRPFDPERGPMIALGDRVRFVPVERDAQRARRAEKTEPARARQGRGLLIEWSEAPALVQDGGRTGVLHLGIARGGALWSALLAHSNASLKQPWSAPALELYGALRVRAVGGAVALSIDGAPRVLAQDCALEIPRSERSRVRYLAIEGGVACDAQLGGHGQLLRASIGGLDHARHRPVQRGDVLVCDTRARDERAMAALDDRYDPRMLEEDFAIELRECGAGERFEAGAFERFVRGVHRVSAQSDRTGLRMDSRVARVDRDTGRSAVMAAGLVQVSADGTPIVLGVDHPTVGGYPVFAQVKLAHLGALLARRPGAIVRYRRPL